MDYESLIKKYDFDTGDILLYQHINTYGSLSDYIFNFVDGAIKYFTNSKYTHSSMIVKNPPWNTDLKGLYVIESNIEDFPDSEDHEIKCGVELVPLEKVLSEKTNVLYIRKLHCEKDDSFNEKLIEAHSVVHNRPYDTIITDWIKVGLNIKVGNLRRKKTFWCSALVAYLYCSLGLLDKDIPWTTISPKQLGTEDPKKSLKFINCVVDKEIKLCVENKSV